MFMESLWTALDNGEISTGGVICDNSGNWMVSYAKKPGFGSILLAELWALFFGPEIVIARNMYSLVVNLEYCLPSIRSAGNFRMNTLCFST